MDLKELYQEIILDHGKNPRNFGKCKNFTSDAKGHNPLCGDKVHIYAQLDKDKKIIDLSFEGEGCAISLASASILTDILKGKDFSLANGIIDNFLAEEEFKKIQERSRKFKKCLEDLSARRDVSRISRNN